MKEKNLLERGVPVRLLNLDAGKEKSAIPPTVNLHKYSTRKPLITSRMVVAAGVLGEKDLKLGENFNSLLGLDPKLKVRGYKSVPNKLLTKINEKYPEKPTILDPFAGTGTIPFEALRLGLNVVALDYNPVAYLILRGTIDYPIKYRNKIYKDVEKYSKEILDKLQKELSKYYPKYGGVEARTYIHCWAVECPTCGRVTPLVNNWILDKKENIGIQYEITEKQVIYKIIKNKEIQEGNMSRGKGTCIYCSSDISNDHIVEDICNNEREILLAVYLDNNKFVLPSIKDLQAIEESNEYLKNNVNELGKYIPTETMTSEIRTKKYLNYWYRMFNPRQLLVLAKFSNEIRKVIDKECVNDKKYATAIGVYLCMILSRLLMKNSRCVIWNVHRKTIGHILATRRPSMYWDHPEVNPFIKTSGSIVNGRNDVLKGLQFAIQSLNNNQLTGTTVPNVEVYNDSLISWNPGRKFDFIITDPPYYDDVQYPEIFQYFQVWHSRILGDLMDIPAIPSTSEDLSVGKDRDEKTFEARMNLALRNLHNLLTDEGVLVMFYAHKSISGWKFLLEALRNNDFKVSSTITLMTDRETSVMAQGKESVFHSLVITARKRLEDKTVNILDLEEEIRLKIKDRYPDLVEVYGNDRVNLMVAASGIVIETITSYSEITSFTKNTAEYAIEIGQKYLIEAFANSTLEIDHIDVKTMLYVWFKHSPVEEISYTDFNQTMKAFGVSEELFDDITNTNKGKVTLIDYSKRGVLEVDGMEPLMATTVIDAVQLALRAYVRGGVIKAKSGIESSPFGVKPIIKTMEVLAGISATKTGYDEGKICIQFLKDWHSQKGKASPTKLSIYSNEKKKIQKSLKD